LNEIVQIAGPTVEPVTVADMMVQLGLGSPTDATLLAQLNTQLGDCVAGAREFCENFTRTAFLTQVWQMNCDTWPFVDGRYHGAGFNHSSFRLPKPPFQSIAFMQYVDTDGVVQTLTQETDYGVSPNDPIYGYQLDPGYDTRPARLLPPWAKPWPPLRRVANAVMVQYKCGYGGPVTASMAIDSAILTGPVFNPGDVGQSVSVPGAIAGDPVTTLSTRILSVDGNGQATLAANATAVVASALNNVWVGNKLPKSVYRAIKLLAQFYWQNGSDTDLPTPRVIYDVLEMYRNRVA
jgi:hypothetical protein